MHISNLPGLILISDMFFRTLSSEQNKILDYQEISDCVTQVRTCNLTIPVLEGLPIEPKI
jgi:hypothetical protein